MLSKPLSLDTPRNAHLGWGDFIRSIRLCRLPAFMICTPLTENRFMIKNEIINLIKDQRVRRSYRARLCRVAAGD